MDKFKQHFLNHEQLIRISQAVATAERGTRGEIVPMIVESSSLVGFMPAYLGTMIMCCFLMGLLAWQPWWLFVWQGLPLLGFFAGSFILGSWLARYPKLQHLLIPAGDQEISVWRRAQSEWALSKIQKTQARTGILLFVSVMERKAVILADEGISKHYPKETWEEIVQIFAKHLHKGEWVEGFEKSVQRCGEILAKHLPATSLNPNEVSDELIIKK